MTIWTNGLQRKSKQKVKFNLIQREIKRKIIEHVLKCVKRNFQIIIIQTKLYTFDLIKVIFCIKFVVIFLTFF